MFAGPDGGRLTNRNLRRPELRIHDLRHTFATILFDAGATAPDVQAVLGNSS